MPSNTVFTADTLRSMFDALPSPVFVVDTDVMVHDYNTAAAEFLLRCKKGGLSGLGVRVQNDLQSAEFPKASWRTLFSKDSFIGKSVREAFEGCRVVRRYTELDAHQEGYPVEQETLVVCSPFHDGKCTRVLLIFEEVRQAGNMQCVIRICSACHQIINEQETLTRIEASAKDHTGIKFSHGLCPTCFQLEMAKVEAYEFEEPLGRLMGNEPHHHM